LIFSSRSRCLAAADNCGVAILGGWESVDPS
jgi:hypothetical protein